VRTLNGATVALLEARVTSEMAALIQRYGGQPRTAPAMRESPLRAPEETAGFIDRLCRDTFGLVVFVTPAAVTSLFAEAEALRRAEDVASALNRLRVACGGSKPARALRQRGVHTDVAAREPFTSAELIDALAALDLSTTRAALVLYGERCDAVASWLSAHSAAIEELCLHEWVMPEDVVPLRTFIDEVIAGRIDAVAFTSTVQCRHLFRIAASLGRAAELADALNSKTTVAVIGPVCRSSLRELGVTSHVMPATPKMAPLVSAIAEYFAERGSPRGEI